jgi:carbon-monoxide dehydrogenase small subunit
MLASARDVVLRMPDATARDIRVAMSGNLCRCTGYVGIVRAIQGVIEARAANGAALPATSRTTLGPVGSDRPPTTDRSPVVHASSSPTAVASSASARAEPASRAVAGLPPAEKFQSTLRQSFRVDHRRDDVWAFFANLGDVTTCLPGTSLMSAPTDDHVEPRMRVKVGPIVAEFEGVADAVRDPSIHSGTIRGSARDTRSGSLTRGQIRYVLEEQGATATRVDLEVGYTLTGPLAQFGRSTIVQEIAARMTESFARNLQARLDAADRVPGSAAQAEPPATLDAGSLLFSVLWQRIRAALHRLLHR